MPIPSNWIPQLREFVQKWKAATDPSARAKYLRLGDRLFDNFVLTEQASSWRECSEWLSDLQGSWCFRGQRESSWSLETSLDRAVRVEYSRANSSGHYHLDRDIEQRELVERFQQQALHHLRNPPAIDDSGGWLALMQHDGAPTRLLDWTMSPYVALYFAVADEPQEARSAVWGLDLQWLQSRGRELLGSEASTSLTDQVQARTGIIEHRLWPDDRIRWQCPRCGDNGIISNWQSTAWDRRQVLPVH